MAKQFLSLAEAKQALFEGKRVQFHWRDQITEINLNTTYDDLRWDMMHAGAVFKMTCLDVANGQYSIIN